MKPLRVLILTYVYTDGDPRYGGEGRVVWETTQALARRGVQVFVVTSMQSLKTQPHPNITLYKIPFAKKNFLNFNEGELLKMFLFCIPLLFLKRIDIIHHLPTNGPNPFARFKFGRIFAESADPAWEYDNPVYGQDLRLDNTQKTQEAGFVTPRGYFFDFWPRAARRFFARIGVNEKFPKGTDIFFYRARSLRNTLEKLRPESILRYVPNGVDMVGFSPEKPPLLPRTHTGIRFLSVGSVSRRKGTHFLVEAFIATLAKHPENELLVVGRGNPVVINELQKIAAPYPQIRFYDSVSNEELPRAYTSADIFCLVTLSGSTPTVLGEALASGLPVIATKGSGGGEAVEDHQVGFLVEPGNIEELATCITYVSEHPEEVRTRAGRTLAAATFFSWDYIANELIEGYTQALIKNPTR